jgi:hypothetical protein
MNGGVREGGPNKTIRTMDLRARLVRLSEADSIWRIERLENQQEEVIVTGLARQLPALSERNGSRAAYRIESRRIEGLHHAQQ